MYIVAIAWMYVVVLMAATQPTVLAGLGTLVFYGVLPCGVVMYVLMAPTRARRKKAMKDLSAASASAAQSTTSTQAAHDVAFSDTALSDATPKISVIPA
jgi:hypothetical protein